MTETSHYSTCKIPEFTFHIPSERTHVKMAAMCIDLGLYHRAILNGTKFRGARFGRAEH